MTDKLNLLQRINEVRKAIGYVQKDKTVSTGSGGYKAVTHDQVTALVREHMITHGIVCYPNLVASVMNPKEVNAAMEQAKQARYEATYDFIFANMDAPEDKLVIRIESHAMDNADKAPGKALSYAKKYAVLKLFEIETGEEEESRYQDKEEFNLKFWIDSLDSAETVDSLQKVYLEAKEAAIRCADAAGMKTLNQHTTKLKTALEKK